MTGLPSGGDQPRKYKFSILCELDLEPTNFQETDEEMNNDGENFQETDKEMSDSRWENCWY